MREGPHWPQQNEPRLSSPRQESVAAEGAGNQRRPEGQPKKEGDESSGIKPVLTSDVRSDVSRQEKEAKGSASNAAKGQAGRQGGKPESRSERSRSNRSHGLCDEDIKRLAEELSRLRDKSAQRSRGSLRTTSEQAHPPPEPDISKEEAVPPQVGPVPPKNLGKVGGPSPNYVHEDQGVWDQTYLAKALLQMKEAEFPKLFVEGSYRPYQYERWFEQLQGP